MVLWGLLGFGWLCFNSVTGQGVDISLTTLDAVRYSIYLVHISLIICL